MAPKSKDANSAPTITTHHSMAAGGQPSAAQESPETATSESEVVLTRPKKLVLQPMHTATEPDESTGEAPSAAEEPNGEDAPLVLETAAETEAANKLAAKLPEGKIELPLEEIALAEDVADEQPKPIDAPERPADETDATRDVTDPGESPGAVAEVDPNEARVQQAEALMASGKYAVHIHESSRSRTGLVIAVSAGIVVILAAVYFAAAEGMLDVGTDLPKFW